MLLLAQQVFTVSNTGKTSETCCKVPSHEKKENQILDMNVSHASDMISLKKVPTDTKSGQGIEIML